ncbi:MAG: hypothetical protein WC222_09430 [Parachlamydiales bacterium]|jgi:hypothetical protein
MSENDFTFLIGSPVDKENLICEIYYKDEMLAEISHESQEFIIEIYPPEINKWWTFPLLEFQEALEYAKNHLIGKK